MPPTPEVSDLMQRPVLASFDKYADAQAAVDTLSDKRFPVQHLAIVARTCVPWKRCWDGCPGAAPR